LISFAPTEEQELARQAMGEFATARMRPLARECDEAEAVPDDFLDEAWQLGLTATVIPEELGGGGEAASPLMNALILEELAYGDAALALAALAPSLFVLPLVEQGSEEQRAKYLPAFCGDRFLAASLAVIEPGALFDPWKTRTTARRRGEVWVLDGEKSLVPLAASARWFLVLAAAEDHRLEAFIVPRDAPGLAVSGPEKNLGLRALATGGLTLAGVEVPAADRLGGEGGADAVRLLDRSRAALASVMTGLARAVMDYCVPYAKERVAFGEPIARKQAIAFMIADMRIESDAMRWLAWKAASELENGRDATRSAHLAHAYAARETLRIADNGVQVLGGHGYIRDHPVEMWLRNARTLGVLEGTAAI
jgi:alkylation response protein AidB-like acyl-CoA dehydrogenase